MKRIYYYLSVIIGWEIFNIVNYLFIDGKFNWEKEKTFFVLLILFYLLDRYVWKIRTF